MGRGTPGGGDPGSGARPWRPALLDVAGLCIAARGTDYIRAALAAWDAEGPCTALGHRRGLDAAGAAFVNGTAAHGEDFDDSFEGTPVHASAVVLPAVLAAAERYGLSGADLLRGYVVGSELMCRLALVAPTAIHRAGFHPTAVIGALGAAAGVGAALRLSPRQLTDALGIAGSMASGIIEYLAEGTWTKRMHAGWAAQAGLRAALLGREGFFGPRTVLEGEHGFFHAFGVPASRPTSVRDRKSRDDWQMAKIAFKPYACGTMLHPFIDCAIRLAREGVAAGEVREVTCRVGEGTVHRLWEPLAEKRRPSTLVLGEVQRPVRDRARPGRAGGGPRAVRRREGPRPRSAGARRQGPLRDRPRERISAQLHGRRARGAAGRQRSRSAPALSARRRARAAGPRRDHPKISRERGVRRLAGIPHRRARGVLQRCGRSSRSRRSRRLSPRMKRGGRQWRSGNSAGRVSRSAHRVRRQRLRLERRSGASIVLLDRFVDLGFNAIDTANSYPRWVPGNLDGESETIIGKWLKTSGKRDRVLIFTKVGSEISAERKGLSRRHIIARVRRLAAAAGDRDDRPLSVASGRHVHTGGRDAQAYTDLS